MMQGAWLLLVFLIGVLLVIGCTLIALRTLQTPLYFPTSQMPLSHILLSYSPRIASPQPRLIALAPTPTPPPTTRGLSVTSIHCLQMVSGNWTCLGIIDNDDTEASLTPSVTIQQTEGTRPLATNLPLIPIIPAGGSIPFRVILGREALNDGQIVRALLASPPTADSVNVIALTTPALELVRIDNFGRYHVRYRLPEHGQPGAMGVAIWLTDEAGHVMGYRQTYHGINAVSGTWQALILTPYLITDELNLHVSAWLVIGMDD